MPSYRHEKASWDCWLTCLRRVRLFLCFSHYAVPVPTYYLPPYRLLSPTLHYLPYLPTIAYIKSKKLYYCYKWWCLYLHENMGRKEGTAAPAIPFLLLTSTPSPGGGGDRMEPFLHSSCATFCLMYMRLHYLTRYNRRKKERKKMSPTFLPCLPPPSSYTLVSLSFYFLWNMVEACVIHYCWFLLTACAWLHGCLIVKSNM